MKKFIVKKKHPILTLALAIFCFISFIFGILFFLTQFLAKAQHNKRWSEYDECGVF